MCCMLQSETINLSVSKSTMLRHDSTFKIHRVIKSKAKQNRRDLHYIKTRSDRTTGGEQRSQQKSVHPLLVLRLRRVSLKVIRPLDDRTSCVRSALSLLGLWRKLYVAASLQSEKMSKQTCSVDIFVDLRPFGCNLKMRVFFSPQFYV